MISTLHSFSLRLLMRLALLLAFGAFAASAGAQTTVTFFHNDVLGSPAIATDADGAVVWKENYLPYGHRQRAPAAGANNKLGFAGKPFDQSHWISYMGARYYIPLIGRFTGVDPKDFSPENPNSFNRYAYANNNPYKYVDPDGKIADTVWDAFNLSIGFQSLVSNVRAGNWSGAAVDGVGMTLDGVAAAIPMMPGGAAAGIAAYRVGNVAAKSAEAAADMARAAGRTSGAAAELRIGDRVFTDVSTGGSTRTLNSQVQAALENVPQAQRAPWHGHCAEMGCLSQAINAGVNPAGGSSRAVNIGTSGRGHGTPKPTCSSCRNVLDQHGIKHD